jgi:hypothetical protein
MVGGANYNKQERRERDKGPERRNKITLKKEYLMS